MSASDVTQAQQLLETARRDLVVAEQQEREAKARCESARDTWLALTGAPRFSTEYRDYNFAATDLGHAREVLAATRRQVAECETDLATAQRYSTGSAA